MLVSPSTETKFSMGSLAFDFIFDDEESYNITMPVHISVVDNS